MQQLIHSAVYQLSHTLSPNKSFPELVETNAMHCYVAFTYVSGSTVFFFCMRSTHRCKYVNVTIIFFHRIKLPVKITLPYHPSAAGEMATLHASLAFHEHGMEWGRNKTSTYLPRHSRGSLHVHVRVHASRCLSSISRHCMPQTPTSSTFLKDSWGTLRLLSPHSTRPSQKYSKEIYHYRDNNALCGHPKYIITESISKKRCLYYYSFKGTPRHHVGW